MLKSTPVIFIMFSVVLIAAAILGVASIYGTADWTWMANIIAGFVVLIMVMGVAFYTLMEWIKR